MLSQKLIYRILTDHLLYTPEEIYAISQQSQQQGLPLEDVIIQKALLNQEKLYQLAANTLELPFKIIKEDKISPDVFFLLPETMVRVFDIAAYKMEKNKIFLTTSNQLALNFKVRDYIEHVTGQKPIISITTPAHMAQLIRFFFRKLAHIKIPKQKSSTLIQKQTLQNLLDLAAHIGATTIKPTLKKKKAYIDFLAEKTILKTTCLPKEVLGSLAETETLINTHSNHLDPTSIDKLGMPYMIKKDLKTIIKNGQGLILLVGPPNSGKRAVLYALSEILPIASAQVYLLDQKPIKRLAGVGPVIISQNARSSVIDSLLRGDADILIVPDLQNKKEQEIAIRAAVSGRLVIASSDKPFEISDMIQHYIVHQRLVRKICPYCQKSFYPTKIHKEKIKTIAASLPIPPILYRASGCIKCHHSGYLGMLRLFAVGKDPKIVLAEAAIRQAQGGVISFDEMYSVLNYN